MLNSSLRRVNMWAELSLKSSLKKRLYDSSRKSHRTYVELGRGRSWFLCGINVTSGLKDIRITGLKSRTTFEFEPEIFGTWTAYRVYKLVD